MNLNDLSGSVISLTFYGGVNEIGGNEILLEDKDTRDSRDSRYAMGIH
jgi:hypothetical protein